MARYLIVQCWLHPDNRSIFVDIPGLPFEVGDVLDTRLGTKRVTAVEEGWSVNERQFVRLHLEDPPRWLKH